MNILHTETLKRWGGQQNRVLSEALGLQKRGHNVIIACQRESVLAQKARQAGIKIYEMNMVKQAYLAAIPRLMKIIKEENIEIVSTHSSVDSWAGGIAAKLTGRHLVRFRHNLYPIGRGPLAKFIYSLPDRIIVTSNAVKDVLRECGLINKEITAIPSAVNIERFHPDVEDIRGELNIPSETTIIGNTSTFANVKGQEFLFQSFNSIYEKHPCILLFAGRISEPFKNSLLSHVKKELHDKIVFLGHRDDIPRILKTIDIFVFPSVFESISTALLEAMIMGKPLVVSDVPTFKEIIADRVNGLYFKVKDSGDMAEKVNLLLKDKELRMRIGRKARDTALKKFTINSMIDKTEAIYKELYKSKIKNQNAK
ncbi:MAG: glycosyltransferase family 4 protein [Nitrospirae bacterium]|nr:glycosyltransferase family 4 protein [Nitrospirota bacterium]